MGYKLVFLAPPVLCVVVSFWYIWGYNRVLQFHCIYFASSDDANRFNELLYSIGYSIYVKKYLKQFDLEGNEISNTINAPYEALLPIEKINKQGAIFTGKVSIIFNLRMLKKMRRVVKLVKIREEEILENSIWNEYTPIFE